jgi:hypothetical protein
MRYVTISFDVLSVIFSKVVILSIEKRNAAGSSMLRLFAAPRSVICLTN